MRPTPREHELHSDPRWGAALRLAVERLAPNCPEAQADELRQAVEAAMVRASRTTLDVLAPRHGRIC